MYIGDWMDRGERYWPEALAIVDAAKGETGRFTYRQMNRRANRLARWLRDTAGIQRGDRVGFLGMNGVECLDLLFACGKIGAIFVPFNWRSHPRELIDLFGRTKPKVLVFDDEFRAAASEVLPCAPSVTHALHLGGPGVRWAPSDPGGDATPAMAPTNDSRPYETTLADIDDGSVTNDAVDAEDILLLLFTGGTTGLPKAAQISYRMVAWNTLNTVIHELQRGDVTISHTPMFHTGGLLVYTLPLLTLGGTVVIMRKWGPEEMLELIEREQVSLLFCVPTQFQLMMDAPRFSRTSFQSVRFLTSGGAPLPIHVIHRYRESHGVVFKQGFGMTEFGPGIFSMSPEFAETKAGSIGRPNYFIDARIVDDESNPVPSGVIGELVLKGPAVCSGYFEDAAALQQSVDAQGWFHTGDMARMDDDGFYYIADRKKDMFISGGENVYPVEIERVLYQIGAIAQCAVFGVPDAKWGEVGLAAVVLRPGTSVTSDDLIEHCRANLARYKVPKSVVFLEQLPISAAGKILKRELRDRFS
ncbi:acyl-CoA synthetase [Chondromyces crocatus]|uniref:Long-chain fatty acid--CoA ligase n=1 Tax=Chondromyces crocatus TaxID=52 RepID=A0A0K1EEK7_CHOCO|nr:long-chain fatty acid--CoA ligase [Chondromyces crocatus]AKT39013.1 long-chain fatty acid--CoA ligase [Chondromyces crocatus]